MSDELIEEDELIEMRINLSNMGWINRKDELIEMRDELIEMRMD